MSNTPENPVNPEPPKAPAGPWIYSGLPGQGPFTPPVSAPVTPSDPISPPAPAAAPAPPAPPVKPAPTTSAVVPPPAKPKPSDASLANVIDTIEAIIIALIIALSFRAFIVEAFVIPTGSMAPTLLGAHFKAVCPQCGYEFDLEGKVAYQTQIFERVEFVPTLADRTAELRNNRNVPLLDLPVTCPNCRYHIPVEKLPQFLRIAKGLHYGTQGERKDIPFAWANNGDRILVLKYLYAVTEPKRWDVIVFKEPEMAQTNYIKRCIGLPHETIQIVNGDIFVGGAEATDRQIARKPEEIQQFLWQLVYDNDYYPLDEARPNHSGTWVNPWQPAPDAAAQWFKGTTMRYSGAAPSSLAFNLLPSRSASDVPYTLNTLGYNGDFLAIEPSNAEFTPRSLVGDLRLEAVWTPVDAAGTHLQLTLGRPNNCYRISWDAKGLSLEKLDQSKNAFQPVIGATLPAPAPLPQPGIAYRVSLNNVDRAVQFHIDGKKVLSYEQPWDAAQAVRDEAEHPNEWSNPALGIENRDRLTTQIRIDVGGPCELSHLKLFRDLYYTEMTGGPGTGTRDHPITLGADEFFALGDNSRRSADGRMWKDVYDSLGDLGLRPGIVPRRYLLGKAFFVYWPAGYRATDNEAVPIFSSLPLIPNTGNMRIIR